MASNSDRRSSSSASRRSAVRGGSAYDGLGRDEFGRSGLGDGLGAGAPGERYRFDASGRSRSRRGSAGSRRGLLGGSDPRHASYNRKVRLIVTCVVVAALALSAYLVAVNSSLFAIKSIVATPTQHISSETISSLAAVPEGSTLFNIDEEAIAQRIQSNPWVQSVSVTRSFPDRLDINVVERTEAAIVMLSSGTEAWRLSSDGHWIEAIAMQQDSSAATPSEQASAQAKADGVVLITDVPATVSPKSGSSCTDETVLGVLAYMQQLPSDLTARVVSYKAPSLQGISAILSGGIEVALGSPNSNIAWKGEVALAILSQYSGSISYVNVRTPDTPTWRGIDSSAADSASASAASATGASSTTATTATAATAARATTASTSGAVASD